MNYTPKDGFPYYYNLVSRTDCKTLFSSHATFAFLSSIDEEKAAYRYAADKWSIKEIVGHMADHERIKIFRAFMLSRNEPVELWGYDQNSLVENSRFREMTFQELIGDLQNVRKASTSFVNGLSNRQLQIKGKAKHLEISLEEFLASIIGHEIHHITIIKEKYI